VDHSQSKDTCFCRVTAYCIPGRHYMLRQTRAAKHQIVLRLNFEKFATRNWRDQRCGLGFPKTQWCCFSFIALTNTIHCCESEELSIMSSDSAACLRNLGLVSSNSKRLFLSLNRPDKLRGQELSPISQKAFIF
jgi:hypothetical protein